MHVMMLAQCYAPEEVSGAVLITELAVDLVHRGHQVTVITGAPSYPYGMVFPGYKNQPYQVEWLDGVRVVRVWSYISQHKTFWRRILHYGTYSAAALYGGIISGKPDVLMNFSPPLPLGLTAWALSRLWGVPWVLQLEDLYPDAAIAAGLLTNRIAISVFSWMERFEYKKADHISLISEGFRKNLLEKGVLASKISLIPVWADPDLVKPLPKQNSYRSCYGLGNKFVVIYAGNLGMTSSLEDLIEAANILRDHPDIFFLMIGEGIKKDLLEEAAQNKQLNNILFLPYQPRDLFPEMMATADVNLVTLNQSSSLTSLPSKLFNAMSSARPVLAVAPLDSEMALLIKDAKCGVVVPPDRPAALAEAILHLKQNASLLHEMGNNGRMNLISRYSRAHCTTLFEQMFLSYAPKEQAQAKPLSYQ